MSLNLYTYCINNPLIYYDPTGHSPVTTYINGVQITFDPTYKDIKTNADGTNEFFGTRFIEFVYEESSKVKIKDPSYYYNKWSSPPAKEVSVLDVITDGNTWKKIAVETFTPVRNFFVDIFTDEDRTDKSAFSYTPETKAKYDEELIEKLMLPGASTYVERGNETGKGFGEIRDYGVDKGTDEAAKWALGKCFEKAIGPIIGGIMRKSGDDVIAGGIRASDDIIESGIKVGEKKQSIVYRVIRNSEKPTEGLTPKNPKAKLPLESHVIDKDLKTQYISTTTDINIARKWAAKDGKRIVKIDLNKLDELSDEFSIFDLSTDIGRNMYLKQPKAQAFAKASSEVVIKGNIPSEAVEVIK